MPETDTYKRDYYLVDTNAGLGRTEGYSGGSNEKEKPNSANLQVKHTLEFVIDDDEVPATRKKKTKNIVNLEDDEADEDLHNCADKPEDEATRTEEVCMLAHVIHSGPPKDYQQIWPGYEFLVESQAHHYGGEYTTHGFCSEDPAAHTHLILKFAASKQRNKKFPEPVPNNRYYNRKFFGSRANCCHGCAKIHKTRSDMGKCPVCHWYIKWIFVRDSKHYAHATDYVASRKAEGEFQRLRMRSTGNLDLARRAKTGIVDKAPCLVLSDSDEE